MLPAKGYVLISLTIVAVVLGGLLWYLHIRSESEAQRALQQAAQGFLEEYKDGRFPKPPTASEVWAEQEKRAAGGLTPAEQARRGTASARAPGRSAQADFFERHGIPLLSSALLLATLGLVGNTYRLTRQRGEMRTECDRLAHELENVRMRGAAAPGRPPPPWQEAALMMVRSSTVPAVAYDLDARVLEVSEAFTAITGYTRIDMPDVKSWFTKLLRTPDDELDAALESFRTNVRGGEIETRTVWTQTGEARTWLCQPLEVWPLEGDALLLVARATDVTAQTEEARAAHAEAETLLLALREAREAAAAAQTPSAAMTESGLASELARRAQEIETLTEQVQALNERNLAQQAEMAALRSQQAERAQRAEAAADRNEHEKKLLEAAYRSAGCGLCTLDTTLRLVRSNDSWQQLASDVGDANALTMISPCAREALRSGQPVRDQVIALRNRAGAERHWRLHCQPIADDDGSVAMLAVTAQDVSDAMAQVASLQQRLDRFERFAEGFEDAVWIADPRAPALLYASAQAARLRGRPLAAMMEDFSQWTAAVHEEDRDRVQRALSAAALEGDYNIEYRVVREDGSVAWLHDRGHAVYDDAKRLRFLAGVTADVTVRRNTEELTRRTLDMLRALVESAPAIIWLKDAQGRYLYANREYARITGFAADQLHGRTDLEVFPRALAERMHDNDARALAAASGEPVEESFQLASGMHHFVARRFAATAADAPAAMLGGIAIEITQRRRREDALRAEESRYRAIAANLPEALLIARENRVLYANAQAAALLGAADADALAGTPLPQLAGHGDTSLAEAAKALPSPDGSRRRFATRLKARDGREIEAEVSAATYETQTERAVEFVLQDVSERNARMQALKEAETFFHGLCDAAPAALRVLDSAGQATYCSRHWEAMAGGDGGADWFAHVHPEDVARVRSAYTAPARRNEPGRLEYRLRDGAGRERWVLDTLVARHDADGQWRGCVSAAVDISQRKRAEEALRGRYETLAELVDECPAPVWTADGSSGYANQACLEWLGAKHEPGVPFDLAPHVHAEDREAWLQAKEALMKQRKQLDAQVRLRRHDGEYRQVRVTAAAVGDGPEQAARCVGFIEDVTPALEAAQALERAEARRAQVVGLLADRRADGLGQVRHTAELVQVMFPDAPDMQQASATVLAETQRLEQLMEKMLQPLRA
jgi:PAS domain S-box-containing protein